MPQPRKSGSSGRKAQGRKPAARKPTASASKASGRKPAAKASPSKGSSGRKRGATSGGRAGTRRPDGDAATASPGRGDEPLHAAAGAVRELLSRGVMITAERLQETLDDAVRRGRMTRADAEELVQVLLQIGRRQTQDALTELEGLLERSAGETRDRARSRLRSVAAVARRAPGTDRALRSVDRARRAAGLGASFPISGYDELTAAQVKTRLSDLSPAELRKVRDHERRNAKRKSVLGAIEKQLG